MYRALELWIDAYRERREPPVQPVELLREERRKKPSHPPLGTDPKRGGDAS